MEEQWGLCSCLRFHWRGLLIVLLPIIFAVAMVVNNELPYRVVYVLVIMMICWITEIFPMAITAMLPVICFPLMNIMDSNMACSLYFKDTLVSFMVTIIIACSMESTKLHEHLAITILKTLGASPKKLHAFLVILTTTVSVLIPNTICIAFMSTITKAVLEELGSQGVCKIYDNDSPDIPKVLRQPTRVSLCFYLSVAYASSIGGIALLTGSPNNLVVRGIYEKRFPGAPDAIDYPHFLLYGIPPMLIITILLIITMEVTYMGLFRQGSEDAIAVQLRDDALAAAKTAAYDKYMANGSLSVAQCSLITLYLAYIVLIFTRRPEFTEGWADIFTEKDVGLTTAGTIIIFLVFALPAKYVFLKCWDESSVGKTPGLLEWKFANVTVPWDLIFIIGCGGTLSEAARLSGLSRKLADFFGNFKSLPAPLALLIMIFLTILFSNLTVNTSVMNAISPAILQLGIQAKMHPLFFMMSTCLASSMAFLMPPACGPNALVAAYGNIRPITMIKGGLLPTLAALIVIFIFAQTWGTMVYSDLGSFPKWVNEIATAPDYGEKTDK